MKIQQQNNNKQYKNGCHYIHCFLTTGKSYRFLLSNITTSKITSKIILEMILLQ